MNELEIKTLIRPEELDGANYFVSLFETAVKNGVISPVEAEAIKEELVLLTAELADQYAGGNSFIREEDFSELGASVLYQLGLAFRYGCPPEKTGEVLKKDKLSGLRKSGYETAKEITTRCREKLSILNAQLSGLEYTAYYGTAAYEIDTYLSAYNCDFLSHLTPDTLSCIPFIGFPALSGVEYAEKCLDCYLCEVELIGCFDNAKIAVAGKIYGDVEIFGVALRRAVGLVLCGKDPSYFDLDRTTVNYELYSKLKTFDEETFGMLLDHVAAALKKGFALSDGCFSYVSGCINDMKKAFALAVENDNLSRFFCL